MTCLTSQSTNKMIELVSHTPISQNQIEMLLFTKHDESVLLGRLSRARFPLNRASALLNFENFLNLMQALHITMQKPKITLILVILFVNTISFSSFAHFAFLVCEPGDCLRENLTKEDGAFFK